MRQETGLAPFHADHVRSLAGLVHDGILAQPADFEPLLQTRHPLLDPQTNAVRSENDTNAAASCAGVGENEVGPTVHGALQR